MNLKSCTNFANTKKEYVPNKIRSHPMRCLSLPICLLILFILLWFVIFPVLFVNWYLVRKDWIEEPSFYYWIGAYVIFLILSVILVCIWRCMKDSKYLKSPYSSTQSQKEPILLNKTPYKSNVISTLQRDQSYYNRKSETNKIQKESLDEKDQVEDLPQKQVKVRPSSLELNNGIKTRAEFHSLASPLTPREIFFWDLIESANKICTSTTHNFIENEKQMASLDNCSLNSPKSKEDAVETRLSKSSAEYFIANVPNRKSLTAEVFMYINDEEKNKQDNHNIAINIGVEEDDVFEN